MGACFGSEVYEEMYGPIRDAGDAPAAAKAPKAASSDMFTSMMSMVTPYAFGRQFTDLAVKARASRPPPHTPTPAHQLL